MPKIRNKSKFEKEQNISKDKMPKTRNKSRFEKEQNTSKENMPKIRKKSNLEKEQNKSIEIMPKIRNKSSFEKEASKKVTNQNNKVLDKSDGDVCKCKQLNSIVQKLHSVSEKLASESLCDSYDHFSKYISSLLRGLPKKAAFNLKQKLVSDILQVVNAQGDNPSLLMLSNRSTIEPLSPGKSTACSGLQDSTIPDMISGEVNCPSGYPINILQGADSNSPFMHASGMSIPATITQGSNTQPSRESTVGVRVSKNSVVPTVARTRAQKRKQNFVESDSKRISKESHQLTVAELLTEVENEASSSCSSMPEQDDNEQDIIDFEESNELYEVKPEQEIVKNINFGSVKEEAPDPLGENNEDDDDIAQLFLCDVCLTHCPNREALSQHFQQAHPDYTVATNSANSKTINESPTKILGSQELEENFIEEENVEASSLQLTLNYTGTSDGVADLDTSVISQNDVTTSSYKEDTNNPTDGLQIKIVSVQELGESSKIDESAEAQPLKPEVRKKRIIPRLKSYCLYCKKILTNVRRHVIQVHGKEKEVCEYLMAYNEEERNRLMRNIINKGNYQYNMSLIAKGENPVRGQKTVDIEKYVACKNCFGSYIKKNIYRHYKRCFTAKGSNTNNLGEKRTKPSKRDLKNFMLSYVPAAPQASEALQNDIIKHMIKDNVSQVAQSDPLILSFGSRAYDGGKVDCHIRNVISKMRDLSRILILMKERNKDIQTFEDCFSPVYFNDIIDVVKTVGKHAEPDSHSAIQKRLVKVGPSFRDCAFILKDLIIETDSITTEERDTRLRLINDFIELITFKWKQEFGFKYDRNSRMEALQLSVVPNSDDIIVAFKHITKLYDSLIKQLKRNPITENFCVLAKKCIVQIAILNRRKPDEISHALLDHYKEKSNLSEPVVSENCVKFRVPGTSCEEENCVLTKPMVQAVDALIAARDQLNITSKYLFPKPMTLDISEEQQVIDGKVAVKEVRIHIRYLMKKPQHFLAKTIVNHGVNQKILLQTIVPETHSDDVTMAFAFIAKSYELLIRELETDPTPARYCVLAKRCIAHLIILNRCKQSEVTEALLDEYKQIKETMTATTDSVQVYRFQRLRKNQVTLFLNNQIKMAIDTLVSSRESLKISSKYLFAQLNTFENTNEEVFNGEEIINGLAKTLTFQLKVPDNFTVANLRYHKVEKKRLLEFSVPRSEDIVSLFIIIAKVYETLKTELKENPTVMKYCKLAKMCIAHLIILNRCEQTEVIHILLQNYEQIRNVSGSQEVFDFPGSKSESTPLVLSKLMKEAIDALISVRNQLGIISKYLFALPNGNEEKSVFSAEQAVKALKHMNTNQIKQSFNFTADALRNHNVNQETLLGKSLDVGSASVSGNLADPGTKQKNMTCSRANPSKKVPTKSSISIDITENPDLTETATERIGIKDSSAKTIILPEKHTSLEKTATEAEQSDVQAPESSQECTFASKFANFCLPVINSDSDSEDSYRTPIIRRRWSDEEKEVVYKYFGRHLLNLQNPGRQEISKMVQREPVLKNRSLDQVNVYVNNIVTEKVKLTPYVIKRIKELSS